MVDRTDIDSSQTCGHQGLNLFAPVLETGSKGEGSTNEAVATVAIGRIYMFSTLPKFFLILHFPEHYYFSPSIY